MSEPVTLGLIGCGGMMGAHLRGLKHLWEADLRDFRVVATCDIDKAKAVRFADEIEAVQGARPNVYTDVAKLLAKEKNLEAVDISTVHRAHHTVAIPCFEAGKHVTIEKPLALTMRAGKLMLDAAGKAGTVFQVAENYRRSPDYRAINWAIKSGRIGKLRMMFWIDVGERRWYWTWREHRSEAGGGWVLDGGVHHADLFRYHVGEVVTVSAQVEKFDPIRYRKGETLEDPVEVDVEDCVMALLTFDNGALGEWTSTSAAPGVGFNRHGVYGEEGSLIFGEGLVTRDGKMTMKRLVRKYMASLSRDEKERWFPGGVTDTVATELEEFFRAIRGGPQVEITGLEGYKDQAICEAVYESAAAGKPVRVADIESLKIEKYQRDLNEQVGIA
ncbi:MAG: Gfo/Idh/MocA family oxidoreductase [Armatimonadota bacterium]|nr:MAG: Gfo/Idh/MocA family oxidoreductase [Armatimonadota bacterium]